MANSRDKRAHDSGPDDGWLFKPAAARYAGYSYDYFRTLIREDRGPRFIIDANGKWKTRSSWVDDWMVEGHKPSAKSAS